MLEMPFADNPWKLTLLLLLVTPGVHLLLTVTLERRRLRWRTEYPAVLVGDPLLALAAGLAVTVAPVTGWPAGSGAGLLAVAAGWTYGAWQARVELLEGRYTWEQTIGPSKLWHQLGVYPLVGHWVPAAVLTGYRNVTTARDLAVMAGVSVLLIGWAWTVMDAIRHPREGHGTWSWQRPPAAQLPPPNPQG